MARYEQGERIKEALKRAGMTQAGYCQLRGIPLRTLQNWISGKTVLSGWMMFFIMRDLDEIAQNVVDKG